MDANANLPDLLPVIIPPISHPPFHCQGKGLIYKQHSRESVETLNSWITNERSGTPLRRTKDWWRAQLLLYGLDPGKSSAKLVELTEKLKSALLKGLKSPTAQIIDLENELNAKFRLQNADAREKKYMTLTTDESRAAFDPVRFLKERFPTKGKRKKDDLVVLKLENRYPLHAAAESLGLCTISADAPRSEKARWAIVGCDRNLILERKREIEAEEAKRRHDEFEAKRELVKAIARELEAQVGPGEGALGDVVGEWYVEAPAISREWSQVGTEFRMSVYFHLPEESEEDSEDLRSQGSAESYDSENSFVKLERPELLWANFDLGLVHGVLHADVQLSQTDSFPSQPIPFSWRGRDFSEQQIQLNLRGENKGTITFLSSTKLKGVLKDCAGTFKFEGYKVSTTPKHKYPAEWNELTERQWNIECVSRWH